MTDAVRLLFVTLSNDVGSERIVSELGRQGAACAVLGPKNSFAALSRFVDRTFDLPRACGGWAMMLFVRTRLSRAIAAWGAERVVPLDELSALLLRTIAGDRETDLATRKVLVRSFGSPSGYAAACHRWPLMRAAASAGVRTPPFDADPAKLDLPVVVKRDHSSGSGGVDIARTGRELAAALRRAEAKRRVKRLVARLADFDHGPDPILVQGFVNGDLAMRTVVTVEGRVLDGVSFRATRSHPEKRASTVLEPIDVPEMDEAVRRVVATLGCSGFVSFDFIVDPQGRAFLLEMNARPIGSTHLGELFGHDLARAFLTGQGMSPDVTIETGRRPRAVALFPKELERDPSGAGLEDNPDLRHDVPWHEPKIVAAYASFLEKLHPAHADQLRRRLNRVSSLPEPAAFHHGTTLSQVKP